MDGQPALAVNSAGANAGAAKGGGAHFGSLALTNSSLIFGLVGFLVSKGLPTVLRPPSPLAADFEEEKPAIRPNLMMALMPQI